MKSRREFLVTALSGVTVLVTGCGREDSALRPTGGPVTTNKIGEVADNHGHRATIAAAQLTSGQGAAIDIRGQADHTHSVTLTADELTAIRRGTRLSKVSGISGSHTHTVTFNPGAV